MTTVPDLERDLDSFVQGTRQPVDPWFDDRPEVAQLVLDRFYTRKYTASGLHKWLQTRCQFPHSRTGLTAWLERNRPHEET